MSTYQETLVVPTRGQGLVELTTELERIVRSSGILLGLATLFVRHTSASLVIQENADPSAARDLVAWMTRLAPEGDPRYTHTAEGPDDMPAHLRAAVTRTAESIPVRDGRLVLGTWQGVFLWEHRHGPQRRELVVHVQG